MAKEWTKEEKAYFAGFLTAGLIDWAQTREIAKNPEYYEKWNPILGKSPSIGEVDTYFPLALGLTGLASHLLPELRRDILKYGLTLELGATGNNYKLGVGMKF